MLSHVFGWTFFFYFISLCDCDVSPSFGVCSHIFFALFCSFRYVLLSLCTSTNKWLQMKCARAVPTKCPFHFVSHAFEHHIQSIAQHPSSTIIVSRQYMGARKHKPLSHKSTVEWGGDAAAYSQYISFRILCAAVCFAMLTLSQPWKSSRMSLRSDGCAAIHLCLCVEWAFMFHSRSLHHSLLFCAYVQAECEMRISPIIHFISSTIQHSSTRLIMCNNMFPEFRFFLPLAYSEFVEVSLRLSSISNRCRFDWKHNETNTQKSVSAEEKNAAHKSLQDMKSIIHSVACTRRGKAQENDASSGMSCINEFVWSIIW